MTLQQDISTERDLARFESEAGIEFVDGQVVEKNVSFESSVIGMRIGSILQAYADRTGRIVVCDSSLGYQCFADEPARFRKPDVSAIRVERITSLGNVGMMPIPADLVVEVISPQDNAYEVNKKLEDYLANGFALLWIVYPNTRTVHVRRMGGSPAVLHENDPITGESVLPGFTCQVAEFFAQPAGGAKVS